ncbi:MAG: hypothetical protein KGQ59_03430 [Bdellovibrionales bacterium]|nr:hypothetical protein [Bdellovibrionales bacterium]
MFSFPETLSLKTIRGLDILKSIQKYPTGAHLDEHLGLNLWFSLKSFWLAARAIGVAHGH